MKTPAEIFDEGLSNIFKASAGLPEAQKEQLLKAAEQVTEAFRQVERLGMKDPLTGLPNRAGVLFDLYARIESVKRYGKNHHLAVVFIDLDNFKAVNDELGHATGDEALRQAASRLKHALRKTDTVGRIGGDELILLLSSEEGEEISGDSIREKVRTALDGLVFWKGKRPFPVGSSIGIAFYPGQDEDAIDAPTDDRAKALIDEADAHMYVDKKAGKEERLEQARQKALKIGNTGNGASVHNRL